MLSLSIVVALAASLSSRAEENGCNAEPGCAAGCPSGCCCPRCGCHEGLCPVCHPYCEMKKVTKYKYCCICEDKCIPHGNCETLFCHHRDCEQPCGCTTGCTSGCESGNCGCGEGCCHCKVYEVKKLVKIPYTCEVPVHKCWVEWVCPRCNCCCNGDSAPACTNGSAAPTPPPAPPAGGAKSAASDIPPVPAGASLPY
jgi:hypothetical protein